MFYSLHSADVTAEVHICPGDMGGGGVSAVNGGFQISSGGCNAQNAAAVGDDFTAVGLFGPGVEHYGGVIALSMP